MKVEITATNVQQFQQTLDLIQQIGGQVLEKTVMAKTNEFFTTLFINRSSLPGSVLVLPATIDIISIEVTQTEQGEKPEFVYRIESRLIESGAFVDIRVISNPNICLKINKKNRPVA